MAAPRPVVLSATTTEQNELFGAGLTGIHIKNIGSQDILLDFDRPISGDSYLLETGEFLDFNLRPFVRLYYKTSSGTSTIHLIKLFQ